MLLLKVNIFKCYLNEEPVMCYSETAMNNNKIIFKFQVCEGDTVVVYVSNYLRDGGSLTIHWHGLHMRGTQYMDGVPMVTQCPVLPWDTFR